MPRIAVVARFAPDARERVRAVLEAGPPFDLAAVELERHSVYLSAREAVFTFEGGDVLGEVEELVDGFLHPEVQEALGEWRRLVEEEPRLAHEVFSWSSEAGAPGAVELPGELLAGDLADRDAVRVAPEDTIGEAVERLAGRGGGPALVVDYGRLIGVLAPYDVLRSVAARTHPSEARVREWMRGDPVTVAPGATLDDAVGAMVEHGLHHVPVVEGDHPVGLLELRRVVGALSSR